MKKQKVCWKITTRCNQHCKYCFGFFNIGELPYNDNEKVLEHLVENGVTDITWTGGEAILYPRLNELIKVAKEKGIKNKLVTNGIYLSKNDNEYTKDILNNIDYLNLSIDSISNDTNIELGKENNHHELIKQLLEKMTDKNIKIDINTVVSKKNIDKLAELGGFLNNYIIDDWKFLKFMPIRERSLENRKQFEVSDDEVEEKLGQLKTFNNIVNIRYKKQKDFERSTVILPNADIIQTRNGNDRFIGNLLENGVILNDYNEVNRKIKILIAYNDDKTIKEITNIIDKIDYAKVVGTSMNETEAVDKILTFKPDIVFVQYEKGKFDGLNIIQKTKDKLNKWKMPIFNLLDFKNEVIRYDINELTDISKCIGNKLNALIRTKPCDDRIIDIIKEYKENNY